MLNNPPFYNRTIRKIVVAFGTMFNEIFLQRFNRDGTVKKEIFKVPLSYGSKEKYLTRITADPNLTKSVSTVVPRIAFDMTGISYDTSRKQASLTRNFALDAENKLNTQFVPIPYDFNFTLSIFVRNTEDGTQILEQILPFFKPDYTLTVNFIPEMGLNYDMPVILNSVSPTTDYEGDMMSTRLIVWDLEFTVKGYIWPIVRKPVGGLIGQFSNTANAFGSATTNLYSSTDAAANNKVVEIIVQSDPLGVDPESDFGFSETINEFYSGYQPAPTLPAGYVTLAGLTWAPMTTGGTYASAQTYAANFTGLDFPPGTWRTATVAELQSLTAVLSYADAQSVYGWAFSSHAFNIWSSESGRVVNFFTGANVGTSNTNNFNFLVCKTPA